MTADFATKDRSPGGLRFYIEAEMPGGERRNQYADNQKLALDAVSGLLDQGASVHVLQEALALDRDCIE